MSPCRTGSRPASVLSKVDLPEPFGPMIVTTLPAGNVDVDAFQDVALAVAGVQLRSIGEDVAHATLPRYACITSRLEATS